MPIIFVTGLPGHGKTLWTLARLKPLAEVEQRPVFHASGKVDGGIPGLAIEGWQVQKPQEWFDVPANSYMVIDECQRVFPPRTRGSAVPKHVEELETHRHGGVDLYLITQHPGLVDTNVRHLVDRHFHVVRKFGTKFATVYEFPTGVQVDPFKNRNKLGVVRHEWRYPKKVFDWYKSAEVHTVKARLPARVWLFAAACLLVPLMVWFCIERLYLHHGQASKAAAGAPAASAPASAAVVAVRSLPPALQDAYAAQDYLAAFRPRIPGLAFTAPVYDRLTKPVEAPYPSVCGFGPGFPCRCWSQRGFKLEVPKNLCEQLAREPMDPYWLKRVPLGFDRGQAVEREPAASEPAPTVTTVVPAVVQVQAAS